MSPAVETIVRVSLVLVVAVLAAGCLQRQSAALRHWLLTAALACAAVLPLLTWLAPAWHIPSAASALRVSAAEASDPAGDARVEVAVLVPARASGDGQRPAREPSRVPWSQALAAVWAAGALIGLSRLGWGLWRLSRIAARAQPVASGGLARVAARVAASMQIRGSVRLLEGQGVSWLVTWGARRPTVLLPDDARTWTDERAAVVLRHEFAHIVRRDWVAQMLAETLRALHWFNPVVWLATRRVRMEAERACDDEVLRAGVNSADYASHLLDLARSARSCRLGPALAMARTSGLERRIAAMLNTRTSRAPVARVTRLVILLGMLSVTLPAALAQARLPSLSGTVVDPANAPVVETSIVLTNDATHARLETRTDGAGHFTFAELPAGTYQLAIGKPGFRAYKESVVIGARDEIRAVRLQIGAVQESITVKGAATGAVTASAQPRPSVSDAARQRADAARKQQAANCTASSSGGQIVPPTKLIDVRPEYPASLLGTRTEATVKIAAVLGADGKVSAITVVSSPHLEFERAATEAIRQWDFTPTLLNCTPVDVEIGVSITFVAP